MNLLFIMNTLRIGGAESHVLLLARGLQAHGVHCEIAYLRSGAAGGSADLAGEFERIGIQVHYLGCERSFDPRAGARLRQLAAGGSWNIIHSHLPRADAAAAYCKFFDPQQVWVSTVHHPYDDHAYAAARLIPLIAPLWRLADGVIAVSDSVREWCIERLGVSSDAVRTVVHGVDVNELQPTSPQRPAEIGALCIGSIGRYEARKGHETLVRAMVPVLEHFPGARLKIAGHDPWGHGEVLRRLIADLRLEGHVELTGFTSDKKSFFSDVDVFAFASSSEGFGIVVLEAMAAGKAVVISNISPLNRIICPGESGLVAECANPAAFAKAILSLLRDSAYRQRLAEAGRRRVVAEFSLDAMVDKTLHYYRHVMDAARVPQP